MLVCKPGSLQPGLSIQNGTPVLRVRERAFEGAANAACIAALAKLLRVPPSSVRLLSGARSRQKRFAVKGIDQRELCERLGVG